MNYNKHEKQVYEMYENVLIKYEKLLIKYEKVRFELENQRYDLKKLQNKLDKYNSDKDKEIVNIVNEISEKYENKIKELEEELKKALEEINRLKNELNNKCENSKFVIDKLNNQIHKDSSNSGIPTSKEIKKTKSGANTYNHRTNKNKKSGGQYGHKGETLTKEKLVEKIKDNNIKVKKIVHYIKGNPKKEDTIKYKIGFKVDLYVEEHIFKYAEKSKNTLPKEYYSDVTYNNDLKSLVTTLGNYYSLGYNKVKELLYDFSNGIINISEGTIDNIYEEFSEKSEGSIENITKNILNSKYSHTDETTTSENGKETYYRGYANQSNVLYKYHHHKGDKPIKDDNILTRFFGTVISDHEVGIFKYGTNNQDCIVHIGRYCIEGDQNVNETEWQLEFYRFLLKLDRERKILLKYGKNRFTDDEIKLIENEYDKILENAKIQNQNVSSSYWRDKQNTLLKRLQKSKNVILFFIYDFDIPCENNFMERCLRMIKGKTKVSGGFRSTKGGERFGNTMSIIKTARLRKLNPFTCIKEIYEGKSLFA